MGTVYAPTSPLMAPVQGGAAGVPTGRGFRELCLSLRCERDRDSRCDSNPASPKYLSNFGQSDLNGAGTGCALYQGDLLAFTSGLLTVYNLSTPTAPQRIGQNQFDFGSHFLSGTMAYVSTQLQLLRTEFESACHVKPGNFTSTI